MGRCPVGQSGPVRSVSDRPVGLLDLIGPEIGQSFGRCVAVSVSVGRSIGRCVGGVVGRGRGSIGRRCPLSRLSKFCEVIRPRNGFSETQKHFSLSDKWFCADFFEIGWPELDPHYDGM